MYSHSNPRSSSSARNAKISLAWVRAPKNLNKIKRGAWMKGSKKPTIPGIYERYFRNGLISFSKWTGTHWCLSDDSFSRAAWRVEKSEWQSRPWRGVEIKK